MDTRGRALERTHRPAPLARGALLLAVGLTGAYAASVAPGVRDGPSVLWEVWVSTAIWVLCALICLGRAVSVAEDRAAWWCMTAALVSSAAGSAWWVLAYSSTPDRRLPWISYADVGWLAYYPLAYAALVLMVRARMREFTPSTWLDGLVSGLAAAAVVATVAFDGLAGAAGAQSTLVLAVSVAYPVAALLLVLFVVGFFVTTGWRPGRAWLLLGGGLLLQAVADTVYLFQSAAGTYVEATWLDALWLLGVAAMAWSAWASTGRQVTVTADWRTLSTPALATLAATGVLAAQAWNGDQGIAVALAAATILVATCRASLAFREIRTLADSRREARTDELTGLPNRRQLFSTLDRNIRRGQPFAVLLLDLDGFKEINDTLGHGTGDQLLTQVARRLDGCRRPDDVLARLGGDEFALVAYGPMDVAGATAAARETSEGLTVPFRLGPVTVTVEASVGVALYPDHGTNVSDLLSRADVAMYQAKRERSECAVYDSDRNDHSVDRLGVVAALRQGISRGELVVHFQPQVHLGTGVLLGLEALARWQHPQRGLIGPDEFLPAVQHTNVMRPFTDTLLRDVMSQMRDWRRGPLQVPVSVNVSAPNLVDRNFPETVRAMLDEYGIAPRELVIEVTENAVLTDAERTLRVLHDLRELGVGLSIDDFGTGLSSLQRLRMLPVDELKIDRSFVVGLPHDIRDTAVVEASVTLARRMGLTIIAEGVEDEITRDALLDLGCDRAQGFLFAQPLAAPALEAWEDARFRPVGRHALPGPIGISVLGSTWSMGTS